MPQIAQTPSQAPLLMMSQPQPANMSNMSASAGSGLMHNPLSIPQPSAHQIPMMQQPLPLPPQAEILSVSSKKLCSYCNHELGSGAAMIIENLGLFYHIDCFKCSVCQTPIADGNINGTDVRVRNSRLHCANCFSNEEGIKFSCVWWATFIAFAETSLVNRTFNIFLRGAESFGVKKYSECPAPQHFLF